MMIIFRVFCLFVVVFNICVILGKLMAVKLPIVKVRINLRLIQTQFLRYRQSWTTWQ